MSTKIGASGVTVGGITSNTIYPRYLGEVGIGTVWTDPTGILVSGSNRFQVDLYNASMNSTSIPFIQFRDEYNTALICTGTVSNIASGSAGSTYFNSNAGIPLVNTGGGAATHLWTGTVTVTREAAGAYIASWRLMASGAATPIRMSIGSAVMYSDGNYIGGIYFNRASGTVTVRSYR